MRFGAKAVSALSEIPLTLPSPPQRGEGVV